MNFDTLSKLHSLLGDYEVVGSDGSPSIPRMMKLIFCSEFCISAQFHALIEDHLFLQSSSPA